MAQSTVVMPQSILRARLAQLCRWATTVCAWLSISGCVVGPDYCQHAPCVPDLWHHELTAGVFVSEAELRSWWTLLNDPILDELIARARERNLNLYSAATRIQQARLQRAITAAERLPLTNGSSSYTNIQQSGTTFGTFSFGGPIPIPTGLFSGNRDNWAFGFDTAWEIDVFGRIQRSIEAADANWQASIEGYRDVMVILYADVARNYVQVRALQAQLASAQQNVGAQEESLEIAKEAVDAGLAPILDVHQAETNLATTLSDIPPLETALHVALNRIAVLVGEYPGAVHSELLVPAPVPAPPQSLPLALPANLIRQRPDVRQAERALAARVAEIGVATAQLYPQFSLTGSFGVDSNRVSSLFTGDSWRHTVGPAVRWPIFQFGIVRNNIYLSQAVAEEAFVNYELAVLTAAEEVENALVGYRRELERNATLRRSEEAAQKSVEAVMALYREGETNFLNVLETQRGLFVIQNQLAASDGEILVQLISIYRALGGGWEEDSHCHQPVSRLICPPYGASADAPPLVEVLPATRYDSANAGGRRQHARHEDSGNLSASVDETADLWTPEIGVAARSAASR